jgi:hypothetical protein
VEPGRCHEVLEPKQLECRTGPPGLHVTADARILGDKLRAEQYQRLVLKTLKVVIRRQREGRFARDSTSNDEFGLAWLVRDRWGKPNPDFAPC